ncbi:MAG: hypothetical protein ACLQVI_12175 [Polyangiaceae bacterium]
MATTAIIVMEPGGEWPGRIDNCTNVVALCECADDLLRRTREKLEVLHRARQALRVAVLVCNAAASGPDVGRRAQLAHILLGAVKSRPCGRLILCTSAEASRPLRRELLVLAAALTEELRETTATVSLWFSEAPKERAVRIVAARSPADG